MKDAKLNERLKKCNDNFDALFASVPPSHPNLDDFKKNIAEVKKYYQDQYDKPGNSSTRELVSEYERFVLNAWKVSRGERTAEAAFNDNHNSTFQRKTDVVCLNIFNICAAIFWTFVAVLSFSAVFSVGLPIMISAEPFTGAVVTAATFSLGVKSIKNIDECADSLQNFDAIEREERIESACFSFFSPSKERPLAAAVVDQVLKGPAPVSV